MFVGADAMDSGAYCILQAANGILDLAGGLVGLTVGLQLGIADDSADRHLDRAFECGHRRDHTGSQWGPEPAAVDLGVPSHYADAWAFLLKAGGAVCEALRHTM